MGATVDSPRLPVGPGAPATGRPKLPPVEHGSSDAWPHTNRWLPWLLAAFVVMLWVFPFDSIELVANAPFDLKLDRVFIFVMTLVWLGSVFAGGRVAPALRAGPIGGAVLVFVVIAALSILLNVATVARLGELELATKKMALLASYATFFFIVATSVRREEVERFARLFLGLAVICSAGLILEYFTDFNVFFKVALAVIPDSQFQYNPVAGGNTEFPLTGPTTHGLAVAAMLAMALSYAVLELVRSEDLRGRLIYGGATLLIFGAVYSTGRKTGSFASLAAVATLTAYRPKEMLRVAPVMIVLFGALALSRPAIVEMQIENVSPAKIADGASGEGRQEDYEHTSPNIVEHVVTGRGYGTYDSAKYRILDNQYMGLLLETGLIGLAAFFLMIGAVVFACHRLNKARSLLKATPALAATGAAAAFATATALFDVLAFPQVPYLFFFTAGVAAAVTAPGLRRSLPAAPTVAAEPLPPMRDRIDEPLPPLRDELAREAARARGAHRELGRRIDLPGRLRRRPDHVAPGSGTERRDAHDRPAPAPAGARRPGIPRVTLSKQAKRTLSGLGILIFLVVAFSGGSGSNFDKAPALGDGGSADDPFGLGEYDENAAPQAPPLPKRTPRRVVAGQNMPTPTGTGAPPVTTLPSTGGGDGGRQVVLGETEEQKPEDTKPEEPRDRVEQPDRNGGEPRGEEKPQRDEEPDPPVNEQPKPEDCLPGDQTEEILTGIGVNPCGPNALDAKAIQAAVAKGQLSAQDIQVLEKAYRAAHKDGGGKLLGGFALLMLGGGAVRRRIRRV